MARPEADDERDAAGVSLTQLIEQAEAADAPRLADYLADIAASDTDEDKTEEPTDDELIAVAQTDTTPDEPNSNIDDYLANIDVDDPIGLYLKEVAQTPLLDAQEEVQLAQRIEQGRMARVDLTQGKGKISGKRMTELRQNIEDGWEARQHIIKANGRLVISVAKKYMNRGVPFLDLIQDGNIGLIRASKKFDYRRGHKFSTYATWWIRQAITRSIADNSRTIRVPVHMSDDINKMLRVQHHLMQRLGREPSVEEIAAALDKPPKKIENMMAIHRRPVSLDAPVDDDDDSSLGDFLPDDQSADADTENSATYAMLREALREVIKTIPPREARIIELRYGLVNGEAHTLEEVGRKMGVTRERVRQIESQALSRLRHPNIRHKLRGYLENT